MPRHRNTYMGDLRGKSVAQDCLPNHVNVSNEPLPPSYYYHSKTSHTSSTLLLYAGDIPKDIPPALPVKDAAVPFQENIIWRASDFKLTHFRHDMDSNRKALIVHPTASFSNCNVKKEADCHFPTGTELVPYGQDGSQNRLSSTQNCTLASSGLIQMQSDSHQPPAVTVALPGFTSKKRSATQSLIADRLRRARINGNLKALQELVPHTGKGNKEGVMDEIIDYVKYLQLQVKALSQNRLGGEAATDPFIYLEGFGHYLLDQQMLNEPLEKVVGHLMEADMPALTQLLERKGLYVLPISLAEGLSGTSEG